MELNINEILIVFYSQVDASLAASNFENGMRTRALEFNQTGFSENTKRLLNKIIYIGDAAMESQEDLIEVKYVVHFKILFYIVLSRLNFVFNCEGKIPTQSQRLYQP